jgi:hypothetical protein
MHFVRPSTFSPKSPRNILFNNVHSSWEEFVFSWYWGMEATNSDVWWPRFQPTTTTLMPESCITVSLQNGAFKTTLITWNHLSHTESILQPPFLTLSRPSHPKADYARCQLNFFLSIIGQRTFPVSLCLSDLIYRAVRDAFFYRRATVWNIKGMRIQETYRFSVMLK